ncbi:MAG: hypothetical protein SCALA702_34120 [Melioribacteraceae bacterium]|nr:MAG: hypothetical protein SCALA702_34120 [Melioribacteraceae bacterium]
MSGFNDKKISIKKAAKKVFAKFGYQKTTLEDIANLIGIKKNSLYYYFESKEDLFNQIMVETSEYLYNHLVTELGKVVTNKEKLRFFILYHTNKINVDDAMNEATISAMVEIGSIVEESYTHFIDKFKDVCRKILAEGIKTGEFKEVDANEISELIFETIRGYECKFLKKQNHLEMFSEMDRNELKNDLNQFYKIVIMAITK